jgi:glycosyltransferase involved in cell wall biosynthesis
MTDPASLPTAINLRVLTIIETLGRGGAEQALVTLAPELRKRNIHMEVASICAPYTLADDLRRGGIAVHELNVSRKWNMAHTALKLRHIVTTTKPRFDIAHGHLFFGYLAARLLKKIGGVPAAVATLHGLAYDAYPPTTHYRRVRQMVDSRILKSGTRSFDAVTAVSGAVSEHYAHHLGIPPPEVIGNAADVKATTRSQPGARDWLVQRFSLPADSFLVVVPARLVQEKGHIHLLNALTTISSSRGSLRILLLGDGRLRDELVAVSRRLGVEDVVCFGGEVSSADAKTAMQGADLVLLPSISEGLPVAICEAASLGRPILATRVGGIPEALDDGRAACLVPAGSATELAAALNMLMKEPSYREQIARRALAFSKRFSIDSVATKWLAMYERIRAGSVGPHSDNQS